VVGVEAVIRRGKGIAVFPEFFGLSVAVDAFAHCVALTDVKRGQVFVTFLVANQNINAGPSKLGAATRRMPSLAREDDA
jgi:hypothetical protein